MAQSQGTSVSLNTEIVLPNDVIIEILSWLPVKSLLKFKCVCRSWRALISSRRFIKAQLESSKSAPNLARDMLAIPCEDEIRNLKVCSVSSMLHESVSQVYDFSYPFDSSSCVVESSRDGLLLLSSSDEMILWNPSTRTWKTLPDFDQEFVHGYELCYDKSSDDYKVVAFSDSSNSIVTVYSLGNDEWKRIKDISSLVMGGSLVMTCNAFANGKLYCLIEPDFGSYSDILSLDLEEEEFEILQMPSYVKVINGSSLAVSEGSLFLLCPHLNMTRADVWILDGCSVGTRNWTKVVTMPCCPDGRWTYATYSRLLYVLKNGLVMFCIVDTIVVYNTKDGSFRYHHIGDTDGIEYTYVESLVSPLGCCDTE
ncbi:F-box/kelch-repeat protein At3g23880-like [Salvia miltiorrhiza]|uniref:F-box/kelch-repeat protein At3g23880-like n=1 Tax=Salvia miltiorrhiza TaxID=226208 RepID=UPI0025AC5C49|nr:F-box/kelch-repeat protein At3g23880-like [Salvia miltiorrhiza]